MNYIKFNPKESKEFEGYFNSQFISLHPEQFSKYDTNGLKIEVFNNEYKTINTVPYGGLTYPHHYNTQNLPLLMFLVGKKITLTNDSGFEILLAVDDITIKSLKPSNG